MVFVEAQSTWSENIIIRLLMYVGQTLRGYLRDTKQSVFSSTKVVISNIELYIVYTGTKKNIKTEITLAEEFFDGKDTDLNIKVHVITDGKTGDIVNQCVAFTKVVTGQIAIYGRTETAVKEAIKICKNHNLLKECLSGREKEVIDIMTTLFNQERVIEEYVASERRIAAQQAAKEATQKTTKEKNIQVFMKLIKRDLSVEDARTISDITPEQKEAYRQMSKYAYWRA